MKQVLQIDESINEDLSKFSDLSPLKRKKYN
jgi:hypothetical protein